MYSLTYIVFLGLATSAFAYYLKDREGVFTPIMNPIDRFLNKAVANAHIARSRSDSLGTRFRAGFLHWAWNGWRCRICVGQHVAFWMHWALVRPVWDWGLVDWITIVAANGFHLVLEDARILRVTMNAGAPQTPAQAPQFGETAP